MDSEQLANRRLVELGYARHEAHAEPNGSGLRLTGELLGEAELDARGVEAVLAMLPSKLRLLALRLALSRRD